MISLINLFCALFMCLVFNQAAIASVDNNLNNFFNGLGYQSNTTSPNAYQGQAAGYYTGGSLYLRNQVKNYQLVSMELPSFSGGCSGIDTYLGSFSTINSKQLKAMVKNILTSGGMYAFDLALTTTVPQLKSVKDYLQKFVNDINSFNINSCNVAEELVGGVWPKTQASQQQICRDLASGSGAVHDWAEARQECGVGNNFKKYVGDGGKRHAEVIVNKNLVWDALMKNRFTNNDITMAEMLMSLSGTLIVKMGKGDTPIKEQLPSLVDNNFIKTLLDGGDNITVYACDDSKKCLNPKESKISISEAKGLVNQISHMISRLNMAVLSDSGALDSQVRGFLEMTPIPILKLISTEAALGRPLDTMQYSEVIAISVLDQYLSEDIRVVQQALAQEDTPMDVDMQARIEAAQVLITRKLSAAYKKLQNTLLLVINMHQMEQQLSSRLASEALTGQES